MDDHKSLLRTSIKEIEVKSVLVKSKLPDADYVVNPYTGCEFGCLYCYASFMGRFNGQPISNWGNYVYVKINAIAVFSQELERLMRTGRTPSILLSSVTDPYQSVEKKFRLTRGILKVLARNSYSGAVSILTKSPLVLRDIDVLRMLPRVEIGMTITTTDDEISRFLELRAPVASQRLQTLATLHAEGFETYAFIGPLLPHIRYQLAALDALFSKLAHLGVGSVYVEHINLRPYIRERLFPIISKEPSEVKSVYWEASNVDHRAILDAMVMDLVNKYQLRLRLNTVLYHG